MRIAPLIVLLSVAQQASASDVKLYGLIDTAATIKNHQANGGRRTELGNGLLSTSYWGLEGQEQLGGQTSAFFKLESNIAADTGTAGANTAGQSRYWNRQAHVGLGIGPWRISVGRQFAAHIDRFVSTLDVWGAAGSAHAVPMGLIGINRFSGDNRVDDAIRISFVDGPLQGSISVSASESRGRHESAELALKTPSQTWTLFGANYHAPDALVVQGQRPALRNLGLGGQIQANGYDLIGYAAHAEFQSVGKATERHSIAAINLARFTLPWLFRCAYTFDQAHSLNGVPDRDGTKQTLVLSADHYFSKRTRAYLSLTHNSYGAGYRLDPLNIAALARDPNATATSAIGLGLRHAF